MATTFQLFPRLPPELRVLIWRFSVESQTVKLYVEYEKTPKGSEQPGPEITCLFSPTPVPAILHTCRESRRESRRESLYERLFWRDTREPRYIWVNFNQDVVDVAWGCLRRLKYHRSHICKLNLNGDNSCEAWLIWLGDNAKNVFGSDPEDSAQF